MIDNLYSSRFAVLLVASNVTFSNNINVFGKSVFSLQADRTLDNYAALLSGSNFCFDFALADDISYDTFIDNGGLKYTVVILACPFSDFPDSKISVLRSVSYNHGVSLISSYLYADSRCNDFFGIYRIKGRRLLRPLKVKFLSWPRNVHKQNTIADYGMRSGLPGLRKRGLSKLSFKASFFKVLNLLKCLIVPYANVDLSPDVYPLCTTLDGRILAWSYQFGKATNYYFALHSGLLLDKFNEMHRLVRTAIETNSGLGMISAAMENTMVLRLDDPGACSNDYLGNEGVLLEDDWRELGAFLVNHKAPISVMYTPGWVDDGDKKTGSLLLDDHEVAERIPGKIYDSARVKYVSLNGTGIIYDHVSEYKGLNKEIEAGRMDIHSHGLTHLNPNHRAWAAADDRHKNTAWYREFVSHGNNSDAEKDSQLYSMTTSKDKIQKLFGQDPCAFTPSGHRHDPDCDHVAHQAGYLLFSSDYTGILKDNMIIRNWKIPSVFLYLKDASPFAHKTGYPLIGIFHDYEIKKEGLEPFQRILETWRKNGITRFISMRELAASLCISIQGRHISHKSILEIIIRLPEVSQENKVATAFVGTILLLRVILPENMLFFQDNLTASGVSLVSVHKEPHTDILKLLVKLEEKESATISLPLQYASAD